MKNSDFDNAPERLSDEFVPWQISYKNNSPERLQEIETNLNNYSWSNEELFTDVNTFRSNFNYDKRTPEQKKVLDDFYKNFLTDKMVDKMNKENEKKVNKEEPAKKDKNTKRNNVPEKVEAAKKTPSYTDESAARHQEIINNLYNFYETRPELFIDRPTFEKAFEYNKRSNRQKQWLDTFWKHEVEANDLYV